MEDLTTGLRSFRAPDWIANGQSRTSLFKKLFTSLLLLAMAGVLFWYAACSNRIAARDVEFIGKAPLVRLFPEVWRVEGRAAFREHLNAGKAAALFRHAVGLQPVMIDAWLDLAGAELSLGREEQARKIADFLEWWVPHVSTWKWDELLLAYDMGLEGYFTSCFNFILQRLPSRASEASRLAARYWGGWTEVLPHVTPANRAALLNELMRARQPEAALVLWSTMRESSRVGPEGTMSQAGTQAEPGTPADPRDNLDLRFCGFLMDCGRLAEAKAVWRGLQGENAPPVTDGGFEKQPLNRAFGWRFGQNPEVGIERSFISPGAGSSSLHLNFRGTRNVSFHHVSQVVPVEPGEGYVLRFLRKSRNLTTDQGVFVEVSGYQCKGLAVAGAAVTGSLPWAAEELRFTVPPGCRAVLLQVRRKESLSFDSKISGDYWLDGVSLERDETPG